MTDWPVAINLVLVYLVIAFGVCPALDKIAKALQSISESLERREAELDDQAVEESVND